MKLELSFVTIEYNCSDDIDRCIESITENCAGFSYEIIVSSNSLYENHKEEDLKKEFSRAKWIFNNKNLGFAGAMNRGISASSGECIIVLNPDSRIVSGNLSSAYDYLFSHPEVGILGPKIVDNNGSVQDSCRNFLTPLGLVSRTFRRVFLKKDVLCEIKKNAIQPVDWIIGAFMIINRRAIETVGLFDDNYFLYVEDMDWCMRFWKAGFKVVYYPDLIVQYKGDRKSTSPLLSGNFVSKYTMHHIRSYLRFLRKTGLLMRNPRISS